MLSIWLLLFGGLLTLKTICGQDVNTVLPASVSTSPPVISSPSDIRTLTTVTTSAPDQIANDNFLLIAGVACGAGILVLLTLVAVFAVISIRTKCRSQDKTAEDEHNSSEAPYYYVIPDWKIEKQPVTPTISMQPPNNPINNTPLNELNNRCLEEIPADTLSDDVFMSAVNEQISSDNITSKSGMVLNPTFVGDDCEVQQLDSVNDGCDNVGRILKETCLLNKTGVMVVKIYCQPDQLDDCSITLEKNNTSNPIVQPAEYEFLHQW